MISKFKFSSIVLIHGWGGIFASDYSLLNIPGSAAVQDDVSGRAVVCLAKVMTENCICWLEIMAV